MVRIIVCALILSCSLADRNVVIYTDGGSFRCGSRTTLSCKMKKFSNGAEWLNEGHPSPIARCIKNKYCKLSSAYTEKYEFTHDVDQGVFNLTIKNITKHYDGSKLICSDGSSSDNHIIKVEDYELRHNENTKEGTLTVETGCISMDTHVSFSWKEIEAISKTEKNIQPQILNNSVINCSKGSACGLNQKVKHTETISVQHKAGHHLKVAVEYGYESVRFLPIVSSFEEQNVQDMSDETPAKYDVVIIGTTISFVFTTILIIVCCIFKRFSKNFILPCHEECMLNKELSSENENVTDVVERRIYRDSGYESPPLELYVTIPSNQSSIDQRDFFSDEENVTNLNGRKQQLTHAVTLEGLKVNDDEAIPFSETGNWKTKQNKNGTKPSRNRSDSLLGQEH